MSEVIYKYKIPTHDKKFKIELPQGSHVLCVREQGQTFAGVDVRQPTMWVRQDLSLEKEWRHFRILMTGEEFSGEYLLYIGTYEVNGFVGHVFEVGKPFEVGKL